jgi:hypothetical protein
MKTSCPKIRQQRVFVSLFPAKIRSNVDFPAIARVSSEAYTGALGPHLH